MIRTTAFLFSLTAGALWAQEVNYSEHVAPIIYRHCATCHRPGEAAPFSLLGYDDVARRGQMIAAVTESRYMPPWKAEASHYRFRDERRLSDEEIATIRAWVDGGKLQGDPALEPPLPEFPGGWELGEPDLVVEMKEGYSVNADGPDVYRNFVIPLGLTRDRWVRAIALRPSARQVVHHVLYFTDTSGRARVADQRDSEPGFAGVGSAFLFTPMGGWAVGQQPYFYPEGVSVKAARGADLVLQYHFHPTGKPELEQSKIGIYFAEKAPERQLVDIQLPVYFGILAGIDIPAGEADYRVRDSFVLPVDVEGMVIGGHAHYIGKEMRMVATLPDGETRTLLEIKDWHFAWQDQYVFAEPAGLPKGTKLSVEIRWDNSAENPHNPTNPPVRVKWGEESKDEMGSITLQLLPARAEDAKALRDAYSLHVLRSALGL